MVIETARVMVMERDECVSVVVLAGCFLVLPVCRCLFPGQVRGDKIGRASCRERV